MAHRTRIMRKRFGKKAVRSGKGLIRKAKKSAGRDALDKLNAYLDAGSAEPMYWLNNMWHDQQNAVTYKQLREAIETGFVDQATLQAWQQDYAGFVNEKLQPVWAEAMQQANTELEAKYPDYFFDFFEQGVQDWVNDHAGQWVAQLSGESTEAIGAMVMQAATGRYAIDELARVIRPAIGLTKTQSLANLNYYNHVKETLLANNPTMKAATAAKRAQSAALKYAARQHRYRAYTIATTEMAYAYNKGMDAGIRQAQAQGLLGHVRRVWSTAADERVCTICMAFDGVAIEMDEEYDFPGKTLYAGQKQTPPAHPRCRCACLYEEDKTAKPLTMPQVQDNAIKPWPAGNTTASTVIKPSDPANIPVELKLPDGMQYVSEARLGGTGKMQLYQDAVGADWLFKPAQSKSGTKEMFRAFVQKAAFKVQWIIDPQTAVPVGTGELGGAFGAFQKKLATLDNAQNLKVWQHSGGELSARTIAQLQRENVTDWLLGNFDSHGGNFIVDEAGRLVGIDKEQSFKHMTDTASHKMSLTYHPNAAYGETEPIYNTLYRRFAAGELDMNLQDTLAFIQRAEAVSSREYREIFREYAEALYGPGKQAEELLDAIVERKEALRDTFRTFYSELLTARSGTPQAFIWADEAAEHLLQPLAAVRLTPQVLQGMNLSQLKQLAKQKKIAYYNNMNKNQLVTAISDPAKAPEMSAQVRDRLKANAAARQAAAAKPEVEVNASTASSVFTDLAVVPESASVYR